MSVSPDDFLWISIISILSALLISGLIYLIPCHNLLFYLTRRKPLEIIKPQLQTANNNEGDQPGLADPQSLSSNLPNPPFINGPQGHGFYTSGPWKIDTLGNDIGLQFSQPQLIMADYLTIIDPSSPLDGDLSRGNTGNPFYPNSMTIDVSNASGDVMGMDERHSDMMMMFM